MTRRKKSRKPGPLAPTKQPREPRTAENTTGGKKKGKGQKPGQRQSTATVSRSTGADTSSRTDPRKGSRRKIPLVSVTSNTRAALSEMTPAEELRLLEQDEKLQQLVERFEEGAPLTDDEQRYLDEKSDRYEQLAGQLGIELDDEDEWDDEEY